jgi:hypothetical protein
MASPRRRLIRPLQIGIVFVCFATTLNFSQVPKDGGRAGKIADAKSWTLPNAPAPNNTRPDQCWHAVGSAPDGDIYISGHDHATNSMLYRLNQKDDTLRWVGDAKTASTAASNWLSGETCQKFHTRPVWHNGRVYVASLDRSTLDNAWQSTRGFHWYAYDIAQNTFTDLSASEPGGVGAAKLQILSIQPDPKKNVLYGVTIPECKYVSYDVAKKVTTPLARPSQWTTPQYIYSDRVMWVDSRSRLYITAGNDRGQWNKGEPVNVFNHVWYYDPASGFGELTSFPLQGANAMECGGWNREHTKWYGSDDHGHLYCFDDAGQTWTYLGRPDFDANIKVWSLEVSPSGDKLYVGRCDNANGFSEFDIASKTSKPLFKISDLDDQAASTAYLTGYDSWDRNGNFYVADFSMNDGRNVIMTRCNPVKIKVAKGVLPELVEVTAEAGTQGAAVIKRTGATTGQLKVIYEITGVAADKSVMKTAFGSAIIPAGSASAPIPVDKSSFSGVAGVTDVVFTVSCDGDNYIAGNPGSVSLGMTGIRAVPREPAVHGTLLQTLRNTAGAATAIRLTIARPSMARVDLFDPSGRLVKTVAKGCFASGAHDFSLGGTAGNGNLLSGIFIVTARVGNEFVGRKAVCIQ